MAIPPQIGGPKALLDYQLQRCFHCGQYAPRISLEQAQRTVRLYWEPLCDRHEKERTTTTTGPTPGAAP